MADLIALNCLVLLEELTYHRDDLLQIQISCTAPVTMLKSQIYDERKGMLVDDGMILWKLKAPISCDAGWEGRIKSVDLQSTTVEEMKLNHVSAYFPDQPNDQHLHIIVQRSTNPLRIHNAKSASQGTTIPQILCTDFKSLKDGSLLEFFRNKIRHIYIPTELGDEPAFLHKFTREFYQMLTKKAAYTVNERATDSILPGCISLFRTLLGEKFEDHFMEVGPNTLPSISKHEAMSYIPAISGDFEDSCSYRSWSARVNETCFTAFVVDPALRKLGDSFNRGTVVTPIPVCDRLGNERLWKAKPSFHVSHGIQEARCATLLGMSESKGETEEAAMVKMALMSLHAWRLSQFYVENPEHVILCVYVGRELCTIYMFYKDADSKEEKFCLQCIFWEKGMFKNASSNLRFLRMMFNFAKNPPHISDTMKPRYYPEAYMKLHELISRLDVDEETSSDEHSTKPSTNDPSTDSSTVEIPSGADLAEIAKAVQAVVEEPALHQYPHILRLTSKGRDCLGKWSTDDMEHQILRFLQSAKSEKYSNLAIPVEEFIGRWIIMPYYTDLSKLSSLSLESYLQIRLQLVEAVAFLHEQGIVHRDIKIRNLVVRSPTEPHGSLNIIDFGVSSFYKDGNDLFFGSCGTPGCTAPEVDDGREYDPRYADVYATGLVLRDLAELAKFDDELPLRLMDRVPSSRPTAAALFSELCTSKVEPPKRLFVADSGELPPSKRRALEQ